MNNQELQQRKPWHPQGWRDKERRHMPSYADHEIKAVTDRLANLPGLVEVTEIERLKEELCAAGRGEMFVLQMGASDEWFRDASPSHVKARMKTFESVRKYLSFMLGKPVLPVGLVAGNYAKSRPSPTEVVDGITVTSYYGDAVNDISPNPWGRKPDANRMLWAYEAAQGALKSVRAGRPSAYTSHEGANLHFEEALLRKGATGASFYASSAHLLLLESINLFDESCYLEFCRGILNPIGVRVGPQISAAELLSIYLLINPEKAPGKIVFVTSFGSNLQALEDFIRVLQDAGAPAVWMSDPVRENAPQGAGGYSAEVMNDIVHETERTVAIHAAAGSRLGGLYLETSPAAECGHLNYQQVLQICSHLAHARAGAI